MCLIETAIRNVLNVTIEDSKKEICVKRVFPKVPTDSIVICFIEDISID